jgi:hypothetical protein
MTIAEDLKESVRSIVCHEMDVVHDSDWFKDFVKGIVEESIMDSSWIEVLQESEWFSDLVESIVDDRLKEIRDSEKDSEKDSDGWKESVVASCYLERS